MMLRDVRLMLKERALAYTEDICIVDSKASDDWPDSFLKT